MGDPPDAVLDHDHRAIDDQAEVDRPQAHQAGRDAGRQHDVRREQHRQRNRQATISPARKLPSSHEQHDDDQHAAFDQIVHDGVERAVDQIRLRS